MGLLYRSKRAFSIGWPTGANYVVLKVSFSRHTRGLVIMYLSSSTLFASTSTALSTSHPIKLSFPLSRVDYYLLLLHRYLGPALCKITLQVIEYTSTALTPIRHVECNSPPHWLQSAASSKPPPQRCIDQTDSDVRSSASWSRPSRTANTQIMDMWLIQTNWTGNQVLNWTLLKKNNT
jgi:hypothetical protein